MKVFDGGIMKFIYLLLFAVFPILSLYAYNIEEAPITDLVLPLIGTVLATFILLSVFRLILRSFDKAIIGTYFFLLLFFSFGHVRDIASSLGLKSFIAGGLSFGTQFILGPIWAILFVVVFFLLVRTKRNFSKTIRFLSTMGVILIIFPLVTIGIYGLTSSPPPPREVEDFPPNIEGSKLPDIYYIILDTYARNDVLEEVYGYDNSEFTGYLEAKGFYIADGSASNYKSTLLSLASSLNMRYLTPDETDSTAILLEMIRDNEVSQTLKGMGYSYVFIGGGFCPVGIERYVDEKVVYKSGSIFRQTDFMSSLIYTTALHPFHLYFAGYFGGEARTTVLYALDKLAEVPDRDTPTFVYAHIMPPHPPFIFDEEGNPPQHSILHGTGAKWQSLGQEERYINQLVFINGKVKELVSKILAKSSIDPIIIIQADHGIWWGSPDQQSEILNAVYLPEDKGQLYSKVSPVNTFRIIFNESFGQDYKLLDDKK